MTASSSLPISAAGIRRRRPSRLQRAVLAWYEAHGRSLGFRRTREPWAVLVSEVMAQQTQVGRVDPAWEAFMIRFPTPRSLATASPADVLRAWNGLGYNRRAVALQRAARLIDERHEGHVPRDLAALEALPGVGPYTARAVLAIAFGRSIGAVDVNVRRVLVRMASPSAEPMPPAHVQAIADELVPPDRPGDWAHALMDLGATLCRPIDPRCEACPVRPACTFGRAARIGRSTAPRQDHRSVSFERTNRWLRGRIVRRLAAVPDDRWLAVEGPIGMHDDAAITRALAGLERDGIIERSPDGSRARLPPRVGAV